MSIADNLLRRVEVLEKALTLKKSGLPDSLPMLCYSDDQADVERAKRQVMALYDVPDEETLKAAGSKVSIIQMPWAKGRQVGITSSEDPRVSEPMREQILNRYNGKISHPVVGTKQDIEGFGEE